MTNNQENKTKIVLRHLKKLVDEHYNYFDIDIARYLLSQVSAEELMQKTFITSRCSLKTNFYGYVLSNFIGGFRHMSDKKNNSIKQEIQFQKETMKNWEDLLKEKNIQLINEPYFVDNHVWKGTTSNISLNGLFLINYPLEFDEKDIDKLSSKDTLLFAHSLLQNKTNLYSITSNHSFLLDLFNQNISDLKENIDEESWVKSLLSSSGMKALLTMASPAQLDLIFSDDSLKILLSEFLLLKNVNSGGDIFNNILALAPPEKWLKAFSPKQFKIDSFFNTIVNKAFGATMVGNLKKSYECEFHQKCFFERWDYFKSSFKNINFNEKSLINFYENVLDIGNKQLFLDSVKYLPVLDKETNPWFYNSIQKKVFPEDQTSYQDVYTMAMKERMELTLPSSSEITVRPKLKL